MKDSRVIICLIFFIEASYSAHNILQYGAVPTVETLSTAILNGNAFTKAIEAANSSLIDREVLVPKDYSFTMMPVLAIKVSNITLTVDGVIYLSENFREWPNRTSGSFQDFLTFEDSSDLHFRGEGKIDGQGYLWWWREIFVLNKLHRPHMVKFLRVRNVLYEGPSLFNSPCFHISAIDIDSFVFRDFIIHVDINAQKKLLSDNGYFDFSLGIPTFPLNTDGIDPSGTNVLIRNISVTNFDDAVAVKPANRGYKIAQCAQNILVENCTVNWGVGMTIGTVPPNNNYNCIKDVTFRNIVFHHPYKAVYIKTNPGENGYGIISNITYENIKIFWPIWWGIYIGPQQQKQPDGGGPGCMLYPINRDCPTQPRVTIDGITLRNVEVKGSVLIPGIIRCDPANPCRNFYFENVNHDAWYTRVGLGFIVENVYGYSHNTFPDPGFKLEQ